jgi:ribosomal protein S13
MMEPKKEKKVKEKTRLEDLTDEELHTALKEAGQKEISPEIKKKVKNLIKQKRIGAYEAVTFVYFGGPR